MRSTDLLRSYLRGLRRVAGAESFSLYVPACLGGLARPFVIHDGDVPSVPELADVAAAEDFVRQLEPERLMAGPLDLPSRLAGGRLIGMSVPLSLEDSTSEGAQATALGPVVWIGLRFREDHPAPPRELNPGWPWLLAFAGALAFYVREVSEILDDPVSGLPGRVEFQTSLQRGIERAREKRLPFTLLMLNPDDFGAVNEQMGREAGDRVIRGISSLLRARHGEADTVAKYGAAIFASLLVDTGLAEGKRFAEGLLWALHDAVFLDGHLRLRFSIGVAPFDPVDASVQQPRDLIRRADLALSAAKCAGGGQIAIWNPGSDAEIGYLDRLSGIFTGNMAKDYRNMALLSDTVSAVAASADFDELGARVLARLFLTLKPDRVALVDWPNGKAARLIEGMSKSATEAGALAPFEARALEPAPLRLLEEARSRGRALEARGRDTSGDREVVAYAVPLVAGRECLGGLYLDGRVDSMSLDSSDLVFLEALAAPLALAFDRARLAEQDRRRQEQERRHLRVELEELRQALRQSELVYRSPEMETVLATVRRVAPTEATVLIKGESGTGKEMIARTIHQLSPRRKQPFVVVDCSSIPTTLVESELFGHERGAFTGAEQRRPGRLAQADRGTVLLDEIGELPLEVQGKLLRFVQEKEVTPVGGSGKRSVDVRVIAATHRDLLAEVRAGRFREDLYHRVNVVRVELPPLRSRSDDILHLARHFLETYSLLYRKGPLSFSAESEALLVRHPWPGNVRELQNRIMRSVILCEGDRVDPAELGLSGDSLAETPRQAPRAVFSAAEPPEEASSEQLWQELRLALGRQVEEALRAAKRHPVPLGRWLVEDLVLEANSAGGGVASRGAAILGMPETTFRRRLGQSAALAESGLSRRVDSWSGVRQGLARLVRSSALQGKNLLKRSQCILLEEILARLPDDTRTGAALLGVTLPTFHRRAANLKPVFEARAR